MAMLGNLLQVLSAVVVNPKAVAYCQKPACLKMKDMMILHEQAALF